MDNPLQYTGKKATVALTIEVLVEIDETNSYSYDVEQAKEMLQKRVLESAVFLPTRVKCDRMYSDVRVQELKSTLIVNPNQRWGR
jgi:hypothetical protein